MYPTNILEQQTGFEIIIADLLQFLRRILEVLCSVPGQTEKLDYRFRVRLLSFCMFISWRCIIVSYELS
jgi:membrane protein CcdC involved in cytochrome C biogenesis